MKYRRFRGDLIQTFKILNRTDDLNPNDFYVFNNNNTREAAHKMFIRQCRLDIKKYSFSFRTARAWNSLMVKTKKAENINAFKRLLDLDDRKEIGLFDHD